MESAPPLQFITQSKGCRDAKRKQNVVECFANLVTPAVVFAKRLVHVPSPKTVVVSVFRFLSK